MRKEDIIVGVDEAGRGPLVGEVVACALHLRENPPFRVKDSKALSKKMREDIFSWLLPNAVFAIGTASPKEIDEINILRATFLAFQRAIEGLIKKAPHLKEAKFIIDGNLFQTDLSIDYVCMKKADELVKEVSCASIMAKVTRDHFMEMLDFLCPEWNFAKHKGYPTVEHFQLLERHDLTPFHRRSFSPCRNAKRKILRRKGS